MVEQAVPSRDSARLLIFKVTFSFKCLFCFLTEAPVVGFASLGEGPRGPCKLVEGSGQFPGLIWG